MEVRTAVSTCPDCGLELCEEPWSGGLCPRCLLGLALSETASSPSIVSTDSPTILYAEPLGVSEETVTPGELLGERYRIESLLGRGGMGQVWRAWDLKLRLEVALKSLHPELFATAEGLELLRDEVRAAREVTSPNVCRLYDLVEVGERELVSMEYVDGVTLLEHLRQHGPLELKEANEIASQLLAGLEAIHEAGLVHRDIKPENVMLTRTGRVVVMDFGLTSPSGTGSMAGTPAYMAPEQARGEAVDARADVFAAGMVLAEMLSAAGGPEASTRQTFWQGVRESPPVVPESPWKGILERALCPEREGRYETAGDLARALEEVAFRVEGVGVEHPYPGLASFREEDAELFFGREAEVEALWKKLGQAHLLGLIGPSGSGKSSFINAGLLPARPEGWSCLRITPGSAPHASLGRALLPELEGDPQALEALVALEDLVSALRALGAWRGRHAQVLLIVDQFEELFAQSSAEKQRRFAELLGRAALDADVHVLLAMRDDFLFHCQAHEGLRPLFSELTPLGPPTGAALRRAIVQPALRCGYRFEDESIVEAMLEEVSRERGALPLLAFTAAQLWERRDREAGYLTRKAYEQIGGVGGALAQHAEAMLDSIGETNVPIVRELFRNLVTAQGTRASRDREELLSVFAVGEGLPPASPDEPVGSRAAAGSRAPAGAAADSVLDTLIDARLLTSYEVGDTEGKAHQLIEIVHESLLSHWPRLVRWRLQDAEGAQLRDELRAQAALWEQHGRSPDYLWIGAAYLDYLAWRERYPGGLTATEEAYAQAMSHHAERRRRRIRMAMAMVVAFLVAVSAVITVLWRQSEESRRQAVVEARRAESAKLLSLGRLELETGPTVALAYTLASLELADSAAARRFALEALWIGPTYFRLPSAGSPANGVAFSPDEQWLAVGYGGSGDLRVWARSGDEPLVLPGKGGIAGYLRFGPQSDVLVSGALLDIDNTTRVWSLPKGQLLISAVGSVDPEWKTLAGIAPLHISPDAGELTTLQYSSDFSRSRIQAWKRGSDEPRELGVVEGVADAWAVDESGKWLYYAANLKAKEFLSLPLAALEVATPRTVARFETEKDLSVCDYRNGLSCGTHGGGGSGEIHLWTLEPGSLDAERIIQTPTGVWGAISLDASRRLLAAGHEKGIVGLWNLAGPPEAKPLIFRFESGNDVDGVALAPSGRWLAAANDDGGVLLFPLQSDHSKVFPAQGLYVLSLAFTPDGSSLVSSDSRGLHNWPLTAGSGFAARKHLSDRRGAFAMAPDGRFVAQIEQRTRLNVLDLRGDPLRTVPAPQQTARALAISRDCRFVAWGGSLTAQDRVIRIHDLESDGTRVLDAGDGLGIEDLEFTPDGFLLAAHVPPSTTMTGGATGSAVLRRWILEDGSHEILVEGLKQFELTRDGRHLLGVQEGRVIFLDFVEGDIQALPELEAEGRTTSLALDPSGMIAVTGGEDAVIRVGPVTGGDSHLLTGHESSVLSVVVSPDGRWLASGAADGTIRLWPMPDLDEPPLHTLPREDLLAKLRTLTNLRAVRDESASTGWSIEVGPFPGWEEVPEW